MALATPEELEQLRVLSRKVAGVERSAFEPACVSRAFGTPRPGEVALTMQGWFDLSRSRSPLLEREAPLTKEDIDAAFAAFELEWVDLTEQELSDAVDGMLLACEDAWSAGLEMTPPKDSGEAGNDGFGDALVTLACLIGQLHVPYGQALRMPVRQAFMLIAAHRRNQGWVVTGTPYAVREMEEEAANG